MSATGVIGGCLLWNTPSVSCECVFLSLVNKNAGLWQGRIRLDREAKLKMLWGRRVGSEMQTSCPGRKTCQRKGKATSLMTVYRLKEMG